MIKHCQELSRIFGVEITQEAFRKLRSIEIRGHKLAEDYCNGVHDSESVEPVLERLKAEARELTGGFLDFHFNMDPRGYFLKIDDDYMRKMDSGLARDWGGYGIVAPEDLSRN